MHSTLVNIFGKYRRYHNGMNMFMKSSILKGSKIQTFPGRNMETLSCIIKKLTLRIKSTSAL